MNYLIDTSTLVRIIRRQMDPPWSDLAARGMIANADFGTVARFVPQLSQERIG